MFTGALLPFFCMGAGASLVTLVETLRDIVETGRNTVREDVMLV